MQIPKKIPLEHVENCANVGLEDVKKINEIIDYLEYQKSSQLSEDKPIENNIKALIKYIANESEFNDFMKNNNVTSNAKYHFEGNIEGDNVIKFISYDGGKTRIHGLYGTHVIAELMLLKGEAIVL